MAGWVRIHLPRDRRQPGTLTVVAAGAVLFGPVPCLGKADNAGAQQHGNPARDPTKPYGDLPTGEYEITGWAPTSESELAEQASYGSAGKLVLDPVTGQALAAKRNGRYGLLIHGGDLALDGKLRPTYGCARIKTGAMRELVALWREAPFERCVVEEAE